MEAIKLQRVAHRLQAKHIPFFPGIIARYIHFRYNSSIPVSIPIGEGTQLGHGGIGVVVNSLTKIGRNVIIAQNVTLAGKDGGAPIVEDWAYIGANSVVLGGVRIGKNAFVGALTLVNKDVPDGAIVAGIPAKVLRIRSQEEITNWHLWVLKQGGITINE